MSLINLCVCVCVRVFHCVDLKIRWACCVIGVIEDFCAT